MVVAVGWEVGVLVVVAGVAVHLGEEGACHLLDTVPGGEGQHRPQVLPEVGAGLLGPPHLADQAELLLNLSMHKHIKFLSALCATHVMYM